MKNLGWVLLVLGILGLIGSYAYDYGTTAMVVSVIVGLIGLWLGMRTEGTA